MQKWTESRLKRMLAVMALVLAAGCSHAAGPGPGAPIPVPEATPGAPAAPGPGPAAPGNQATPAAGPMPAEVPQAQPPALFHTTYMVGLPGYVAVATPGASVTYRFNLPMDRAAVERAVAQQIPEPRMTWLSDLELRVDFPLKAGQTVTVDSAGMPDRWGRKIAGSSPLVLKAFPEVSIRRFEYIPETDEAHPFTGEQVPGVFTAGAPNPKGGWPMLLLAEGRPFFAGGPRSMLNLLPDSQTSPLFYGWMPDGEHVLYADDRTVMLFDLMGKVVRSYEGKLLGGAISAKSGLVAVFQASGDGQVRLFTWNPDTDERCDYGPAAPGTATRIEAGWAPDESQIVVAAGGQLAIFDLGKARVTPVAAGYRRPSFSPTDGGLIYAEQTDGPDSVILRPDGTVLHTLPGQGWFWHASGAALDRSAPSEAGQPPYDEWITNYRLSDGRVLQRGKGLVIGEGPGPGAGAMYQLVLTELP